MEIGKTYNIFNKEYLYRGVDKKRNYHFVNKEDSTRLKVIDIIPCDLYDGRYELYAYPYDVLNNTKNSGDKIWSNTYGEIEFVECKHGFIKCLLDDELEITYTHDGILCWWSNELNCYRFDDETKCSIWPAKYSSRWKIKDVVEV